MAVILRHSKQTLADVQCRRYKPQAGDRVLVRTYSRLDRDQKKKLRRTVQKWVGPDVEILIYCTLDMEISIEKGARIGN